MSKSCRFLFSLTLLTVLQTVALSGCKNSRLSTTAEEYFASSSHADGKRSDPASSPTVSSNYQVPPDHVFIFDGVRGPTKRTIVPQRQRTTWSTYDRGSESRLAILLTDPDSAWLGLAHGLKTIGIPFRITTDWQQALRHRVVLVYPLVSGKVLAPEALRALAAHPRQGGTLIGVSVLGGGLDEVFGFSEAVPSRTHAEMRFTEIAQAMVSLSDAREKIFRLSDKNHPEHTVGLYSYTKPLRPPLAVYDNGTAAITQKFYDSGRAYAIGLDIGAFILQGYNNRHEWVGRSYVNEFEPPIDVLLRLLKALYLAGEPDGVTLSTVPYGKSLMVSLTHDIDFIHSLQNARAYVQFERAQGIRGTYFIQAKYIRDFNDEIFFDENNVQFLKEISESGMEVGSHTVAHAKPFSRFPLGDGTEEYPTYQPYVMNRNTAYNGTILGELRVSKFLVEQFSGQSVISFRPGELSYPFQLPEALLATGYRYSSSVTANSSLSHLPFQLNYSREADAETPIFEFPVTLEDEALPKLGDRLPQAIALAHELRRYGGSFVILIHPNVIDHKLEFERGFIAAVRDFSWFCALGDCGHWWAARNGVEVNVRREGERAIVDVHIPEKIGGLTLELPSDWTLTESAPADISTTLVAGRLVLREAQGTVHLVFRMAARPNVGVVASQ